MKEQLQQFDPIVEAGFFLLHLSVQSSGFELAD